MVSRPSHWSLHPRWTVCPAPLEVHGWLRCLAGWKRWNCGAATTMLRLSLPDMYWLSCLARACLRGERQNSLLLLRQAGLDPDHHNSRFDAVAG